MQSPNKIEAKTNLPIAEQIVILGGGFAGWYAARELALRLAREHQITLVDRVDHMLYTPMLTEVAGGTLRPADIAVPAKELPKRVVFVRGEVLSVDVASKQITLTDGSVMQATQLVFALGATTNYDHVPGASENSLALKSLDDAQRVVARINEVVTLAAKCTDPEERRKLLTILVAGGGYTGVETMAAVVEHLRRKGRAVHIDPDEMSFVLIEPTERLMHETSATLAAYSQKELERDGVRVMLNTGVSSVDGRAVQLTDGSRYETGLLIWDAGITPNQLLEKLDLPKGKHHGVLTDQCLRVQNRPGVWAVGDCAEIPKANGKGTYAPTAQNATREGTWLARNVNAVLRGRVPRPFRYKMLGQLALLSHRRAIADLLGLKIEGFIAWAIWWAIYTLKLPYWNGRIGVLKSFFASNRLFELSSISEQRPFSKTHKRSQV